ncbi:hypothetical protein AB0J83_41740 [Actinoplanes sp. NPDC049596]|uniref:hypothetical protein n=1 Tax=unclassified Actinoplanes TaxID=2626549 RepID=UPI003438A56B
MSFFALTASYSFRVAISFETGGRRYTEYLDRAGKVFYGARRWPNAGPDIYRAVTPFLTE